MTPGQCSRSTALPTAPPMISPSANAVSRVWSPRQPDPQKYDRRDLEGEQRPWADRPLLRKQAVADAGIPGEHQIEKRRDRDRPRLGQIEAGKQPELRCLIEDAGDRRNVKPERAQRAPGVGPRRHLPCAASVHTRLPTPPPCAWFPIRAAPWRRAASRREIADRDRPLARFSTSARISCPRHAAARPRRRARRRAGKRRRAPRLRPRSPPK